MVMLPGASVRLEVGPFPLCQVRRFLIRPLVGGDLEYIEGGMTAIDFTLLRALDMVLFT